MYSYFKRNILFISSHNLLSIICIGTDESKKTERYNIRLKREHSRIYMVLEIFTPLDLPISFLKHWLICSAPIKLNLSLYNYGNFKARGIYRFDFFQFVAL